MDWMAVTCRLAIDVPFLHGSFLGAAMNLADRRRIQKSLEFMPSLKGTKIRLEDHPDIPGNELGRD